MTDITVFTDVGARLAAGKFLKVPLLAGSNQHEGDVAVAVQEDLVLGTTLPVVSELISDIMTQVIRFNTLFQHNNLTLSLSARLHLSS